MFGIVRFFRELKEKHYLKCYLEHKEENGKCYGLAGGDINSGYLSYECIGCPHHTMWTPERPEEKKVEQTTKEIKIMSDCPPGFRLMLDDFCEYCGDFEAEVHSIECMNTGDANTKTTNYIHCVNHPYCKRANEFYKKLQMREVDDGEV